MIWKTELRGEYKIFGGIQDLKVLPTEERCSSCQTQQKYEKYHWKVLLFLDTKLQTIAVNKTRTFLGLGIKTFSP